MSWATRVRLNPNTVFIILAAANYPSHTPYTPTHVHRHVYTYTSHVYTMLTHVYTMYTRVHTQTHMCVHTYHTSHM